MVDLDEGSLISLSAYQRVPHHPTAYRESIPSACSVCRIFCSVPAFSSPLLFAHLIHLLLCVYPS